MGDFPNLVGMDKRKLEAQSGGGYTNPCPEPWKNLTGKGTGRRGLRKKGAESYIHNLMAPNLSYSTTS